jgi:hypothetical protein
MNRTRTYIFSLAAALSVAAILAPNLASAQVNTRRDDYRRDRDDRSDRRDRRDGIETLARRTERDSNSFRAWFERNYSRRRLGRERDNRWLKHEIQELDEAMERVRGKADDRNRDRGLRDFENAMDHARRIDRELIFDNDRDTRFTVPEWIQFRRTLDDLARAYGVRRF